MKKSPRSPKTTKEIKPDEILLQNRELFLYDKVDNELIEKLIKQIKALNLINKKPITLWINSPGGATACGLGLINTIRLSKAKIITIINSRACSMASLISVVGHVRKIMPNGVWMAHDMASGVSDYSGKIKYRAEWLEKHYNQLENVYKTYTNLTQKDLQIARNGELWLTPTECLKKGIVDEIIKIN